jgi:hypothetical protein
MTLPKYERKIHLLPMQRRGQAFQMTREIFEAREIVSRQEVVDEWKRGDQAARARFVAFRGDQRIEPEQAVTGLPKPDDLARE